MIFAAVHCGPLMHFSGTYGSKRPHLYGSQTNETSERKPTSSQAWSPTDKGSVNGGSGVYRRSKNASAEALLQPRATTRSSKAPPDESSTADKPCSSATGGHQVVEGSRAKLYVYAQPRASTSHSKVPPSTSERMLRPWTRPLN